jgi:hypothetical protein
MECSEGPHSLPPHQKSALNQNAPNWCLHLPADLAALSEEAAGLCPGREGEERNAPSHIVSAQVLMWEEM